MQQGLAAMALATGSESAPPSKLTMLAEEYGKEGQPEKGLDVLVETLSLVDKKGERFWEAEMYRLNGELLLMKGEPETKGEANFQQALTIAGQQQAKSLELRATVSLARLWQSQGKTAEAHEMLADIYRWFTEGFDTLDMKEAEALIEQLS